MPAIGLNELLKLNAKAEKVRCDLLMCAVDKTHHFNLEQCFVFLTNAVDTLYKGTSDLSLLSFLGNCEYTTEIIKLFTYYVDIRVIFTDIKDPEQYSAITEHGAKLLKSVEDKLLQGTCDEIDPLIRAIQFFYPKFDNAFKEVSSLLIKTMNGEIDLSKNISFSECFVISNISAVVDGYVAYVSAKPTIIEKDEELNKLFIAIRDNAWYLLPPLCPKAMRQSEVKIGKKAKMASEYKRFSEQMESIIEGFTNTKYLLSKITSIFAMLGIVNVVKRNCHAKKKSEDLYPLLELIGVSVRLCTLLEDNWPELSKMIFNVLKGKYSEMAREYSESSKLPEEIRETMKELQRVSESIENDDSSDDQNDDQDDFVEVIMERNIRRKNFELSPTSSTTDLLKQKDKKIPKTGSSLAAVPTSTLLVVQTGGADFDELSQIIDKFEKQIISYDDMGELKDYVIALRFYIYIYRGGVDGFLSIVKLHGLWKKGARYSLVAFASPAEGFEEPMLPRLAWLLRLPHFFHSHPGKAARWPKFDASSLEDFYDLRDGFVMALFNRYLTPALEADSEKKDELFEKAKNLLKIVNSMSSMTIGHRVIVIIDKVCRALQEKAGRALKKFAQQPPFDVFANSQQLSCLLCDLISPFSKGEPITFPEIEAEITRCSLYTDMSNGSIRFTDDTSPAVSYLRDVYSQYLIREIPKQYCGFSETAQFQLNAPLKTTEDMSAVGSSDRLKALIKISPSLLAAVDIAACDVAASLLAVFACRVKETGLLELVQKGASSTFSELLGGWAKVVLDSEVFKAAGPELFDDICHIGAIMEFRVQLRALLERSGSDVSACPFMQPLEAGEEDVIFADRMRFKARFLPREDPRRPQLAGLLAISKPRQLGLLVGLLLAVGSSERPAASGSHIQLAALALDVITSASRCEVPSFDADVLFVEAMSATKYVLERAPKKSRKAAAAAAAAMSEELWNFSRYAGRSVSDKAGQRKE